MSTPRGSAIAFGALSILAPPVQAATFPASFQESTVWSGLTRPTAVRFAADGRVFVAEKSGIVKVFASLTATTPTVFADLRTNVHNFWDRGLLGLELDPQFPARPYVYVLYTLDQKPGGPLPTWGTPGETDDPCPSPPGPTSGGCAVGGRLSRLEASGDVMIGTEQVLLQEWCQQFPSHSVGAMTFGTDGALYATAGDGASFQTVDYGQLGGGGTPLNVCGDPPVGVGGTQTPPTAEGGALRSLSLLRVAGPAVLNGTLIRIDPDSGEARPDNPLILSPDPRARRIVAQGLRNPFRLARRPGTGEIWIGDVGANTWEEIDRVQAPTTAVANFGWPCYEGNGRQGGYDAANLALCENLYASGAATAPYFTYQHDTPIVDGESCPTGSSSIAGLAFYDGGSYPASYLGALFFTDYSRRCIWAMRAGANGLPNPNDRLTFASGLSGGAVDLQVGPSGDLFYVDYDGGRVQRIRYFSGNQPPIALIGADPTSGNEPLTVQFDGSGSHDPDAGDTLAFAWDLDADGVFDDSAAAAPAFTYTSPGVRSVRLRVTDSAGASATAAISISVGNEPPAAAIATPLPSLAWRVGDVVAFSGSAVDPQQGALPPSALTWTLVLKHCPSTCHDHVIQTMPGIAAGSFAAPDHEYPSFLELRLTATDSGGLSGAASVSIQPQTVDLTVGSSPPGLTLAFNAGSAPAPFTRTVIVGSVNTVSAPSPQFLGPSAYEFASWSDGGAASHEITAPATAATYLATYQVVPSADLSVVKTGPPFYELGAEISFTLTVANDGPSHAAMVEVADPTPAGLTFVGNTGDCSTDFPCLLGVVPAGQSRVINARYLVPWEYSGPTLIVNQATVSSTTLDPEGGNGVSTASVPPRSMRFHALSPCRLADTRGAEGPALAGGETRTFPTDRCGIPATARALALNVTVTGAQVAGHVRLHPAGSPRPSTSTLNYRADQTRGNNAIVGLGAAGGVEVYVAQVAGGAHVILDVSGYFE
jgi:uncharacterized repeat protein (TIGR01451 family)